MSCSVRVSQGGWRVPFSWATSGLPGPRGSSTASRVAVRPKKEATNMKHKNQIQNPKSNTTPNKDASGPRRPRRSIASFASSRHAGRIETRPNPSHETPFHKCWLNTSTNPERISGAEDSVARPASTRHMPAGPSLVQLQGLRPHLHTCSFCCRVGEWSFERLGLPAGRAGRTKGRAAGRERSCRRAVGRSGGRACGRTGGRADGQGVRRAAWRAVGRSVGHWSK